MHKLLQFLARLYKGKEYSIDPHITESALIGIGLRRLTALLRGLVRGYSATLDITRWVFIGQNVEIRTRSLVRLGAGVTLGRGVLIDGLSRHGVTIGDRVNIGPYTMIEATGVVTKLGEGCWIGADSAIGAFSSIGAAGGVRIGNNVIMGQHVSFHSENHIFERTDIPIRMQSVTHQGIVIEDDCWIGAGVIFLDGAYVGRGCVIGAGAVVRGKIPPFSIAVGVPAKAIRSRINAT